jgi:squalene-associated FAD-dependent desaturase
MSSQSVLVIGGGLAGMSSAVALADAGFRVCLFEKRPYLGGRATSYALPDGSEVDNCQHVTLGCCTNLADFYRRVDARDKIRFYDRLYFADARGSRSTIEASWLPPPFHMAPSFLFFGALTFADKRAIANALLAIAQSGGAPADIDGISMLDWLHRLHQTPGAIERFWRVVLVSALNEELARTDARYGIEVFWKAFLGSREGYRVGIPSVPLADLYEGCRAAVERLGGEVRLRSGVREICMNENRFAGVKLEDGCDISADACIVAVPHQALQALLPKGNKGVETVSNNVRHFRTSPITGVHLWFDRTVMTEPFLTLLDHTTQWIFNKSLLYQQRTAHDVKMPIKEQPISETKAGGQYLQLVISASYDLVARSRQEIIDLCCRELAEVLPAARAAKLEKATVIKDVHATFSPEPNIDHWRPKQGIGIENLFLAGDWTSTGWPATMESAVRSGYLAAEAIAAAAATGPSRQFLQPDLAFEGLSRFWAERAVAAHSR